MYELKKIGKVFTCKFIETGPSSYKKRIYWAAVSQRLRNTALSHSYVIRLPYTHPIHGMQTGQQSYIYGTRTFNTLLRHATQFVL